MSKKDGFLKAGQILIYEGEESNECYWIQSGEMRVTVRSGNATQELRIIGPGELVGEMSFVDERPRSTTVTAITDCQFLTLHREDFKEMIDSQPKWIKKIILTLSERLRSNAENKKTKKAS